MAKSTRPKNINQDDKKNQYNYFQIGNYFKIYIKQKIIPNLINNSIFKKLDRIKLLFTTFSYILNEKYY